MSKRSVRAVTFYTSILGNYFGLLGSHLLKLPSTVRSRANLLHWLPFTFLLGIVLYIFQACPLAQGSLVFVEAMVEGEGMILGQGNYEQGTGVRLKAVPQVDWDFLAWEGVPQDQKHGKIIEISAGQPSQPRAIFVYRPGAGRFQGGTVFAIGENTYGQSNVPEHATNAVAVAAGVYHSLALRQDGRVVAWGRNNAGQTDVPEGLTDVVQIAAGGYHSLALKKDGSVVAWGDSSFGGEVPSGLPKIREIAAGWLHAMALAENGTVWGWGDSTTEAILMPAGLGEMVQIATGSGHSLGLDRNGMLIAWGAGDFQQTTLPVGINHVSSVHAGPASRHSLAILDDGSVLSWGFGDHGQTQVPLNLQPVYAASAGAQFSVALQEGGSMMVWGNTLVSYDSMPANIHTVASGEKHSVLIASGTVAFHGNVPTLVLKEEGERLAYMAQIPVAQGYQWYKNDKGVSGQNHMRLVLPSVSISDAGNYQLLATNQTEGLLSPLTTVAVLKREIVGDGSIEVSKNLDVGIITLKALPSNDWRFLRWEGSLTNSDPELVHLFSAEQPALVARAVFVPINYNTSPIISSIGDVSVEEGFPWSFKVQASDADQPANILSYRLVSHPIGMTIDGQSGVISFLPAEGQGGRSHEVTVEVSDNAVPPLTASRTFFVNVNEVNNPPVFQPVSNVEIDGLLPWLFPLEVHDSDEPANQLNFELVSAPTGMTVHPATGVISWTPGTAHSSASHPVEIRVTDDGVPAQNAIISFIVYVKQRDRVPEVPSFEKQVLIYGQQLKLSFEPTNIQELTNAFSYLLATGPADAGISSQGELIWTPLRTHAPSTNRFRVEVSDGTSTITREFTVEVVDLIARVNGLETTSRASTLPPAIITITHSKSAYQLYYSLDGEKPALANLKNLLSYDGPFALANPATIWPALHSLETEEFIVGVPIEIVLWKEQALTLIGGEALIYNGPAIPVAAESNSGLPVKLTVVSGPAILQDGYLIPTGAGTLVLNAIQPGNEVWAAVENDFTLNIAKAAQEVTWPVIPRQFVNDEVVLQASASSGLPVRYHLISTLASLNGNTLKFLEAGALVMRAEQAGNENYLPSAAEITIEIVKAPQTISFAPLDDRLFGAESIILSATATSQLPVTFEVVSGPASLEGQELLLNGVGLVTIRAFQTGNNQFEAAMPVERSFAVAKAIQILSFMPIDAGTFGDAPVVLSATSNANLPVKFQVLSGPGSITDEVLTLQGAGSILVEAFQEGNEFYLPASSTQIIQVAKKNQTITFPPLGDHSFTTNHLILSGTSSSGLPVNFRLVSGPATVTGTELALTSVGIIELAAEQPGDDNHQAAPAVLQRFTVTPGEQTIIFRPIGDQLLGGNPIILEASSNRELPVSFVVVNGPASISGNQLSLIGEGLVVVRAENSGNNIWAAAQAEQRFTIRNMTQLGIRVFGSGTVSIDPQKESYLSTDTVTLRADAADGFEFLNWSGDLSGNSNPASLSMNTSRNVTANFRDALKPVMVLSSPLGGETRTNRFDLVGTIRDNVQINSLRWRRNDGEWQDLSFDVNGFFSLAQQILEVGENRIEVEAADETGNLAHELVIVHRLLQENSAPVIIKPFDQILEPGINLYLVLEAHDIDLPAQLLTFELVSGPAEMTVSAAGIVEWQPSSQQRPGTHEVIVRVSDGITHATTTFLVVAKSSAITPPELFLSKTDAGWVLEIRPSTGVGWTLESSADLMSWFNERTFQAELENAPFLFTVETWEVRKFWRVRVNVP